MRLSLVLVALVLAIAGCDDDGKSSSADAGVADAGNDPALMDPNIADALKSAGPLSSGRPGPNTGDGPPPEGIFGPGGADKAHALGAPVKIALLEKGSEPRIKLRPPLALKGKQTMQLQVVKRFQQQLLPSVDYTLEVQVSGGDEPKGPTEGATEPAPAPPGKPSIKFTVSKAKASQRQMGQLPPDVDEKLGGLKGTIIRANLEPDGSISNEIIEVGKDFNKGLGEIVNALQEMLTLLFSPYPEEPVGKGAFWLATDRARVGGMDVVRYRHSTVEEVEGNEFAVSVNVRLYSAVAQQLPAAIGPQPGLSMIGFESFGKGVFTRKADQLLPTSGQLKVPIHLTLSDGSPPPPPQPGQPPQQRAMELAIESMAAIITPDQKPDQTPAPTPAPKPEQK
jgi:hypothetical protein